VSRDHGGCRLDRELASGMVQILTQNVARKTGARRERGSGPGRGREQRSGLSRRCIVSPTRIARLSGATGEAGLDCRGFGLNRCPRSVWPTPSTLLRVERPTRHNCPSLTIVRHYGNCWMKATATVVTIVLLLR
jgi:hypothetical protein